MKKILLPLIIFISITGKAQKTDSLIKGTHTLKKSWLTDSSKIVINNLSLNILNGHGESVEVKFTIYSDIKSWNYLIWHHHNNDEMDAVQDIADDISNEAQQSLKNILSFQPFKKEFITIQNGTATCNYKMMGKNGYGNDIETSQEVSVNIVKNF